MKKTNQNLYSFWSAAIIICVVLAVFAVLFASAIGNGGSRKAEQTVEESAPLETALAPTPTPNAITASASAAALAQTEDGGDAYVNQIFFLGDDALTALNDGTLLTGENRSRQVWMPESGVLALAELDNATYKSPVTGNNVPASEIVQVNTPAYLILFPSPDNVNLLTEDQVKTAYSTVIAGILEQSPNTKIILSSLTPVAQSYAYEDLTNEIIARVNGWIAAAAEAAGVKYLDAAAGLVGADGFLPESYHDGDGVHLNADGMKAWLDYVKTHAYPA